MKLTQIKDFKLDDNSTNTWWISAITWGEGWHNNHHAEPWTYTFQRKWWEFDVSAYTIYVICLLAGTKSSLYNSKY
jgi:stearoyl-CoA desaturase (delta-9 desaturase)